MRDGAPQKAAEDINAGSNGQTILPGADLPVGVGRDLNYLQSEENVTSGEV
jgi:hypothetical protein